MTTNAGLFSAAVFAACWLLWAITGAPLGPLLVSWGFLTVLAFAVGVLSQRLGTHPCPRCGNRVRNGETDCGACGFQPLAHS